MFKLNYNSPIIKALKNINDEYISLFKSKFCGKQKLVLDCYCKIKVFCVSQVPCNSLFHWYWQFRLQRKMKMCYKVPCIGNCTEIGFEYKIQFYILCCRSISNTIYNNVNIWWTTFVLHGTSIRTVPEMWMFNRLEENMPGTQRLVQFLPNRHVASYQNGSVSPSTGLIT